MGAAELVPTYVGDGYELKESYDEFWKALKKEVRLVTPESLAVNIKQETPGETLRVSFGGAEPLGIWGVSTRGAAVSKCDIYLCGHQVVGRVTVDDTPQWTVLRSEFAVCISNALEKSQIKQAWRDSKKESTAYAGYRFITNAIEPATLHHPDCHARYCLDAVDEEAISRRLQGRRRRVEGTSWAWSTAGSDGAHGPGWTLVRRSP